MTVEKVAALVVLPLVLGVIGNLLTSWVKTISVRMSDRSKERATLTESRRSELVQAFVKRPDLMTHYLIVYWVGIIGLAIVVLVTISAAMVMTVVDSRFESVSIAFAGAATVGTVLTLRSFRIVQSTYRRFLQESKVPDIIVKSIIDGAR